MSKNENTNVCTSTQQNDTTGRAVYPNEHAAVRRTAADCLAVRKPGNE